MRAQLIDSIATFLELTAERRSADPLRTNVIASVALSAQSGRSRYDECRWWVVRDDDETVAMAMRTSPHPMVVAPTSRDAALVLGAAVGHDDDRLPGLSGPRDVVDHLLEGYRASQSPGSRRTTRVVRREFMYELGTLTTPSVEGQGRPADLRDTGPLTAMFMEFVDEVDVNPLSPTDARDGVVSSINEGSLYCWEHEGALVSFAGHAPVVDAGATLVGRVGPVYTPTNHRRHGFASAVTAMVTERLLDRGARVMLYTDASNATSNAIYQALGYQFVDELVDVRFDEH
jgi:GNAT superfamily N-acetyltransferase